MSPIKISIVISLLVLFIACESNLDPASAPIDIEDKVAKDLGRATPTPNPLTNVKKAINITTNADTISIHHAMKLLSNRLHRGF